MLVDDDHVYHEVASAILARSGIEIDYASNGHAAFSAASKERFAMILMDIEIPDSDGYQIALRLRSLGGWLESCPIIAFTSLRPESGVEHFIQAGMNDYLQKPFSPADLMKMVAKWTGVSYSGSDLDPRTRLATLIGEEEADAMIARFFDRLEKALDLLTVEGDVSKIAHRVGGIAGMLGFTTLSNAWLALQEGDRKGIAVAYMLSSEALKRYRTDKACS